MRFQRYRDIGILSLEHKKKGLFRIGTTPFSLILNVLCFCVGAGRFAGADQVTISECIVDPAN